MASSIDRGQFELGEPENRASGLSHTTSTSHNEQAIRMPACRLSNARARGTRHKIVTAAVHIRTIQQAAEQPHCVRRHQTQPAGRLGIRTTYMPCQYFLLGAVIP